MLYNVREVCLSCCQLDERRWSQLHGIVPASLFHAFLACQILLGLYGYFYFHLRRRCLHINPSSDDAHLLSRRQLPFLQCPFQGESRQATSCLSLSPRMNDILNFRLPLRHTLLWCLAAGSDALKNCWVHQDQSQPFHTNMNSCDMSAKDGSGLIRRNT